VPVDKPPPRSSSTATSGTAEHRAALEFANTILPLVRERVPGVFHLVGATRQDHELAARDGSALGEPARPAPGGVRARLRVRDPPRHGLKSKMLERWHADAMWATPRSSGWPGPGAALSGRAEPARVRDHSWACSSVPSARAGSPGRRELVEQEYSWSHARVYRISIRPL